MTLRLYADFNSCIEDERGMWCWLLRHNGDLLNEVAAALDLRDGMSVTLYTYGGNDEGFEFDSILGHFDVLGWNHMWMAKADATTEVRRFAWDPTRD